MSDLSNVLKSEIRRLAKSEAKAMVAPLQKKIVELRQELRGLKALRAGQKKAVSASVSLEPVAADKPVRISAGLICKLRKRLNLTQPQLGTLLGVSTNTVLNWEQDKTRPSDDLCRMIASLRKLGRRKVAVMLVAMKSTEDTTTK